MDAPDPVDALAEQQDELIGLVDGRSDAELLATSRCDGWTVADVLLHLAQTNEMAVASVEGRLGEHVDQVAASIPAAGDIDAWAGALVDLERGEPGTAPTVLRGTAPDLCTVAGQRAQAADTSLHATGPDADAVLRLVRTFA